MTNWSPSRLDEHQALKISSRLPNFESLSAAWDQKDRDVRTLQRYVFRLEEREVAARIAECTGTDYRCGSAACPICLRNFRLWWVKQASARLVGYPRDNLCLVTFIPPETSLSPGGLRRFNVRDFRKRVKRMIRGVTPALLVMGGVDFSFNEHANHEWEPHWQPHVTFITAGLPVAETRRLLKGLPRQSDVVMKRPCHVQQVSTLAPAVSYAFKAVFQRRVTFSPTRNVIKRPLTPGQQAELLPVLDQAGFDGRLILCRARRQGDHVVDLTGRHPS